MRPDVEVRIRIACAPADVWQAVADPGRFAEWSPEAVGASSSGPLTVGARFTGSNRHGPLRWSTACVVVESDPGSAFAFDVTFWGMAVARWRYSLLPDDGPQGPGCVVAEQWWDHRGLVMKALGIVGTGVTARTEHNRRTMTATLESLKADLESTGP